MASQRLGDILTKQGLVSPEQVQQAVAISRRTGQRLGQVLIGSGLVTGEQVGRALADQTTIPYIDLRHVIASPEAVELVPITLCIQHNILPIALENEALVVAMADPLDIEALDAVRRAVSPVLVRPAACDAKALDEIIRRLRDGESAIDVLAGKVAPHAPPSEAGRDAKARQDVAADTPILRLVSRMLSDAVASKASAVHIDPEEDGTRIRYRVDGVAEHVLTLTHSVSRRVTSRLKMMCGLDVGQSHGPQQGQCRAMVGTRELVLSLSSMPTLWGESVLVELLDEDARPPELGDLGLSDEELTSLRQVLSRPQGLVLVCGSAHSGQTTTLHAVLGDLDRKARRVVAIQDILGRPLEKVMWVVLDRQAGMTYTSALRTVLRHAPDVVLLPEIRDPETAAEVFAAAGQCLVLSTLMAPDLRSVLAALDQLGVPPTWAADRLAAVICQSLVRRLCEACRSLRPVTEDELALLRSALSDAKPAGLFWPRGCPRCSNRGYAGQVAVVELIIITPEVAAAMRGTRDAADVVGVAREQGTTPKEVKAARLVLEGVTSLDEARPLIAGATLRGATPSQEEELEVIGPPPMRGDRPAKVLVVDDAKDVRELYAKALGAAGFEVTKAASAREALDYVNTDPPDVIVLDLYMPEMDGRAVCRSLKSNPATARIPLLIATASILEDDEIELLTAGADDFIRKPVSIKRLIARVQMLFRRSLAVGAPPE